MSFPASVLLKAGEEYNQSSSQQHPLGTRGYTRDGRVFRYAQAGAALTVGRLCQCRAPSSWSDDMVFKQAYTSGTTQVVVLVACASTGAKSSDGTTDYYKEGFLFVNDGSGEGMYVPIKYQGGWSTDSTANHYSTVHFQDGAELTTAVSSGTECGFVLNPYKKVAMHPKTQTSIPIGVTPRAVTNAYYFWLQTWGPAAVRFGGTCYVSRLAFPDLGTNTGYVTIESSDWGVVGSSFTSEPGLIHSGLNPVGTIMEVGTSGETGIVFLNIAP